MIKLLRGFWKLFRKRKGRERPASEALETAFREREKRGQAGERRESPLIQVSKERIRIQVGLDFGTSSTKVAFSRYGRRRTQVVDFNHSLPFYPQFCLPSVAAFNGRGHMILGAEAARLLMEEPWDRGFRRFKVIAAGNVDEKFRDSFTEENFHNYRKSHGHDETLTAERITAIYLAHVMYLANKAISGLPEYGSSLLEFDFNICMPIDHLENKSVKSAFERIFKWAEAIYKIWLVREESLDPLRASNEFEGAPEALDESRVFAVPEAVAEVASYIKSFRRKEGLHALIDFGAGTTDVSIFNYMNPFGESKSTWYSARNIPQGTIVIEKMLTKHTGAMDRDSASRCVDVYRQLEGLKEYCKANNYCEIACAVRDALSALRDSGPYVSAWREAYRHLKKQTAWDRENVQIFVTGGGVNLPYVPFVFSEPFLPQLKGPYSVEPLPPPDDFDPGASRAPFERVAVAYGLSIPLPALEDFVLPSQAPDHTPPSLPELKLDRDEIYAK